MVLIHWCGGDLGCAIVWFWPRSCSVFFFFFLFFSNFSSSTNPNFKVQNKCTNRGPAWDAIILNVFINYFIRQCFTYDYILFLVGK
jgi:hypothetical protein